MGAFKLNPLKEGLVGLKGQKNRGSVGAELSRLL
jgi:hypothetical protein